MKLLPYIILLLSLCFGLNGCGGNKRNKTPEKEIITVSIAPLQSIVTAIAGDDFDIEVLVPTGSSPETYSPTPKQLTTVNNSILLTYLGTLNFENEIVKRLSTNSLHTVNLSASHGIELLVDEHNELGHEGHGHSHGAVDPHIWLSVRNLQHIAESFAEALTTLYPDSTKYADNARKFIALLQQRDAEYATKLSNAPSHTFLIYHPALSYLARDYALEQLSIEEEGKDPTPTSVAAVIDHARNENVGYIMYQSEFSQSAVKSIVDDTEIKPIEINPLASNIIEELDRIVNIISTDGNGK